MRRYIRNKGGSIVFQSDYTQQHPGQDGMFVTVVKRPAILLQFEPLLGGPYGHTPWDMQTAIASFGKVVAEMPSFANVRERFDPEQGATVPMRTEPIMVPVHGLDQGVRRHGIVKADGTVVGDEQAVNPMYGLFVLDVDQFCQSNEHARGLEEKIEAFLDDPGLQRGDHYVRVIAKVELPSPNYLSLVGGGRGITMASRIGQAVREGFLDPDDVIRYETWEPRKQSEDILAEMEAIKAERAAAAIAVEELVIA